MLPGKFKGAWLNLKKKLKEENSLAKKGQYFKTLQNTFGSICTMPQCTTILNYNLGNSVWIYNTIC